MTDPRPPSKKMQEAIAYSKSRGQNGKGSETRAYDVKRFQDNFGEIEGKCSHCRRKKPFGETCPHCRRR